MTKPRTMKFEKSIKIQSNYLPIETISRRRRLAIPAAT